MVDESSIDIEPEDAEEESHVAELLGKEEKIEIPEEMKEQTDLEKFLDGGYFYVVYAQKK
ncbi:MAG: hypothetical protein QXS37_06785 [Candidatus Aenigmatarchaeota archaeon]